MGHRRRPRRSGIPAEDVRTEASIVDRRSSIGDPTIAYLARICPEKGLDQLVDAVLILRQRKGFEKVRLRAAGYLGKAHQKWYGELARRVAGSSLDGDYTYLGEVDKSGKLAL